ncbi:MAG: hypothetical protein AAFX10_14555, partial [Pseudomonadota bacterium]
NVDAPLVGIEGVHVRRVNMGLFALEQADTLDAMSRIYFQMGEYDQANSMQQAYAGIYAQNYSDDFLKQVPARLNRALMLAQTGRLLDAKLAYRRLITNIEKTDSGRSLELLPVIYQFADLMQNHAINDGVDGGEMAHRFLRRAVYIADKNENATPLQRADAYIALADYYVDRSKDRQRAQRLYKRAWMALSEDEQYASARDERLLRPKVVNPMPNGTPAAMRAVLRSSMNDDEEKNARLVAAFDLDEMGIPRNVRIEEGDPSGYLDPILIRYIDMLAFRPGFVDGEPARFENQALILDYYSAALAADIRQNTLDAEAD